MFFTEHEVCYVIDFVIVGLPPPLYHNYVIINNPGWFVIFTIIIQLMKITRGDGGGGGGGRGVKPLGWSF